MKLRLYCDTVYTAQNEGRVASAKMAQIAKSSHQCCTVVIELILHWDDAISRHLANRMCGPRAMPSCEAVTSLQPRGASMRSIASDSTAESWKKRTSSHQRTQKPARPLPYLAKDHVNLCRSRIIKDAQLDILLNSGWASYKQAYRLVPDAENRSTQQR